MASSNPIRDSSGLYRMLNAPRSLIEPPGTRVRVKGNKSGGHLFHRRSMPTTLPFPNRRTRQSDKYSELVGTTTVSPGIKGAIG